MPSSATNCEDEGITAVVPRAETVNTEGKQYFSRDRFSYDAGSDTWRCPAGETLTCHEVARTEQKRKYSTGTRGEGAPASRKSAPAL
jgi:hypothetical protein